MCELYCGQVSTCTLYISTFFKVRELAASTLSGLVHCGFVRNLPNLKVRAVGGALCGLITGFLF